MDADAIFTNPALPLKPWVRYMEDRGLDQLFSCDVSTTSAINYGEFMVRGQET